MTIYVIQSAHSAEVKIGYTAGSPAARLMTLQTGSASPLSIRAVWWGASQAEERELHDRFADYRLRGEWFSLADEIVEWIASLPRNEDITFWAWLVAQEARDDPIGDLAGDATQSFRLYAHPNRACAQRFRCPPIASSEIEVWRDYLKGRRACPGAMQALRRAFGEFEGMRMLSVRL